MTRTNSTRRLGVTAAALAVLVTGPGVLLAPTAFAQDTTPSQPPGTQESASPPVKVDPNASGLKLNKGATLAPAKVLDIKSVVEDEGGEERREDSNTDVKFALQADVLFGKDSAKLNSAAKARIQGIADEIKKQDSNKVNVFGFTDNLGSYQHGKVLSKQRAEAVQKVLSGLLSPDVTFSIRGYSEDYPIADNATEDGRKKNRRVEVSFPRKD